MVDFRSVWAFAAILSLSSTLGYAMDLDSGIPADQNRKLNSDQSQLQHLTFQDSESNRSTAKLLGLKAPTLSSKSLANWLDERVALIVSEKLDLDRAIIAAKGVAIYPEAGVFPDREPAVPKPTPSPTPVGSSQQASHPVVVMSNVGAAIYTFGKQKMRLLGLRTEDGVAHLLKSPHRGVIQIGEGLFLDRLLVNKENPDATSNKLKRLAVFFHEARHSDGHGKSLAFSHANCPVGHAYQGYPACDRILNGPYTVGAALIKSLTDACPDCSTKEKTTLQLLQADSLSRVLKYQLNGVDSVKSLSPLHEEIVQLISAEN